MSMFELEVEILSAYNLLDWSGDDWPQPKPVCALPRFDWNNQTIPHQVTSTDVAQAFFEHQLLPYLEYLEDKQGECPRCGHDWVEHYRGHGTCMHSTPDQAWDCGCEGVED